jgi:hypothetical protein
VLWDCYLNIGALSRSTENSAARGSRQAALHSQIDVLERRLRPAEGFIDHVIAFLVIGWGAFAAGVMNGSAFCEAPSSWRPWIERFH